MLKPEMLKLAHELGSHQAMLDMEKQALQMPGSLEALLQRLRLVARKGVPSPARPFNVHESLLRSREELARVQAAQQPWWKRLRDRVSPAPAAPAAPVPAAQKLAPPTVPTAAPAPAAAPAPLAPPTVAPMQPTQQNFAFNQPATPAVPKRMEGMRRGPQAGADLTPPQVPAYRGPANEPAVSTLTAPQVGAASKAPKGKAKGKGKGKKEPADQPKATLTPPTVGKEWGWASEAQPAATAAAAPGKLTPHSEWGWSEDAAQTASKGTAAAGAPAAKATAPAPAAAEGAPAATAPAAPKHTENLPAARDLEAAPVTQTEIADVAGRLENIRALPLEEQAAAMQALSDNPVASAALSKVMEAGSVGGLGSMATTVLPTAGLAGLGYLADDERGALAGAGLGLGARLGAGGLINRARELRGISSALGRGAPALKELGFGWKSPEVQRALMAGGALGLGGGALGAVAGNRLFEKKKPWYQELMGLVPPTVGALNQVAVPYLQMRRGLTPEQVYGYEQSLGINPPAGSM